MSVITVGIDIGTESTKVNLGPSRSCEIVRTASGGHTTPTAVSFSGSLRQLGETASLKGKNAIIHLNRLLRGFINYDGSDSFEPFYMFERDGNNSSVTVEYNGSSQAFESAALVAMLLGKIKQNVHSTIDRLSEGKHEDFTLHYAISISSGAEEEAKQDLLDAAFAAELPNARLVESSECYGAAYARKFPEHMDGRVVLIVDMGHSATTISVLKMGLEEESGETEDGKSDQSRSYKVLSSATNGNLGAGSIDVRLWNHFQSETPALKDITRNSRKGQRLLDGTKKLKELLSQLPEGSVMVENVGANDTDLNLNGNRTLLNNACKPESDSLVELIQSTIAQADMGEGVSISSIEALGGGCRIPWVKDAIIEASGVEGGKLSHSLDDTSVALGAALIREYIATETSEESPATNTERGEKLLQDEKIMAVRDEEIGAIADLRNKIEAHILEMRSAKHSKHGKLLPESIDSYLDQLDDWLFSEESDNTTKDQMIEKYEKIIQDSKERCKEYFEALESEERAKEREMEEEAKKAQLERAGEEEDEDDHDNRRLPKKRRMEIVMKNKAEANELFSDGNFKFAAARYTKALSHCAKFVDLSPEDLEEVNGVKLSLNLNLALAYMKLEKPEQALRVCNDAINIDENSAKALYRRASVYYELKKWDDAKKDAKKASEIAPTDKAIKKLGDRVDIMLKRQKAKEKKMAQKMFG